MSLWDTGNTGYLLYRIVNVHRAQLLITLTAEGMQRIKLWLKHNKNSKVAGSKTRLKLRKEKLHAGCNYLNVCHYDQTPIHLSFDPLIKFL